MLEHIGQTDVASKIQNAWLKTIEDGVHTGDVYREGISSQRVGTQDFAAAVVERLGRAPEKLQPASYPVVDMTKTKASPRRQARKSLVGVDVFLHIRWTDDPRALAKDLLDAAAWPFQLSVITSKGLKIWPDGAPETIQTDHCRCRFLGIEGRRLTHFDIVELLARLAHRGFDFIKTEHLYEFDGVPGFTQAQGE